MSINLNLPPSDEGGGFCVAKDGGRENALIKPFSWLSLWESQGCLRPDVRIYETECINTDTLRLLFYEHPSNGREVFIDKLTAVFSAAVQLVEKAFFLAPLVRGDSSQWGEMSRSDRGDGHSKWLYAKQTER